MTTLAKLLEPVSEPRAFSSVEAFCSAYLTLEVDSPFERALLGGAMADRMGYAFVAGYGSALDALFPERDRKKIAALCVTEKGGVHPRAIETELRDGSLYGTKTFVTLGRFASELLVLAKSGKEIEGRPQLVVVSVSPAADGVTFDDLPTTPFVPEIPHAAVHFNGAPCRTIEGDGWSDFVRPFRTIEDTYVHASFLAWAIARGRSWDFPEALLARALSLVCALESIAKRDPSSHAVHIALGGVIDQSRAFLEDAQPNFSSAPSEDRDRFQRDRRLLDVATKARVARLERAWQKQRASET